MRKKTGPPQTSLKKQKRLELFALFFAFFFVFFVSFFWCSFGVFSCVFLVLFLVFFSPLPRGPLFLSEASLATQIFDVISCGPEKLDLSLSMIKKGATHYFL